MRSARAEGGGADLVFLPAEVARYARRSSPRVSRG
jgi:hypothetical protein